MRYVFSKALRLPNEEMVLGCGGVVLMVSGRSNQSTLYNWWVGVLGVISIAWYVYMGSYM